ncbi:Annexin repeat [Dillenia turbinata]|uniref:Annexin repeat n=1 Tax=Dillenia turbinata TaxID=194707 RepID=A0AAN8VE75_9MAGN
MALPTEHEALTKAFSDNIGTMDIASMGKRCPFGKRSIDEWTTIIRRALGARRAYHALFDHSIEEDVACHVVGRDRKLLVALVSAYRHEGPRVNEEVAKIETKMLYNAIKNGDSKKSSEDDEVVRILSTRSKLHLKTLFNYYKDDEILDVALRDGADEAAKRALIRVNITRAEIDMKEIKEKYSKLYRVSLFKTIEAKAHGNFKDFLPTLVEKEQSDLQDN